MGAAAACMGAAPAHMARRPGAAGHKPAGAPIAEGWLHKQLQAVLLQQPARDGHSLQAGTHARKVSSHALCRAVRGNTRATVEGRAGLGPDGRRTLTAQLMAGAPVASSGMWLLLRAFHAILAE